MTAASADDTSNAVFAEAFCEVFCEVFSEVFSEVSSKALKSSVRSALSSAGSVLARSSLTRLVLAVLTKLEGRGITEAKRTGSSVSMLGVSVPFAITSSALYSSPQDQFWPPKSKAS